MNALEVKNIDYPTWGWGEAVIFDVEGVVVSLSASLVVAFLDSSDRIWILWFVPSLLSQNSVSFTTYCTQNSQFPDWKWKILFWFLCQKEDCYYEWVELFHVIFGRWHENNNNRVYRFFRFADDIMISFWTKSRFTWTLAGTSNEKLNASMSFVP